LVHLLQASHMAMARCFLANSSFTFEAKFNNGMMEGKVDMSSEKGEIVSLGPEGQVVGLMEGVEVLVPPFVPALPF